MADRMTSHHRSLLRSVIAGVALCTAITAIGCQRVHTERVAFEHTGVTLTPEATSSQLAATRRPVDPSTALRLASLGIAID